MTKSRPTSSPHEGNSRRRVVGRAAGVLVHPTSFPGPYGIGELGPAALSFLDFLAAAGQRLWQILPLGPTGFGGSPYQPYSAFAGNPLLVSTERLLADGLVTPEEIVPEQQLAGGTVDFDAVAAFKNRVLRQAFSRFTGNAAFDAFVSDQRAWLDDYALFMALKAAHGGAAWSDWNPAVARRDSTALAVARQQLAAEMMYQRFVQFRFFGDQRIIRDHARTLGIQIIGDLPIFVALDSADVWAHPEYFHLDAGGRPTVVAGVPPDYFSATGQLWGNPLYNWDVMARDGYRWWMARLRHTLEWCDIVRLDHFRGIEAYWAVPAGDETAVHGAWEPGPGADFFEAARAELGGLPIVAEDLGLITPEVERLRDQFELPGMKVLQFSFSDADNPYLPHNHVRNCVVYTGTHDNDTTRGWWATLSQAERDFARDYLARDGDDIAWDLLRVALASVAVWAVVPLQDLLDLDSTARMNAPGEPEGNWRWRFDATALTPGLAARLRRLTELYGRAGGPPSTP